MGDSKSIINVGDLSRPATVLIEKISDAIGGYCKPYQIRRVANAEADAMKIEAAAQIEVTELQQRALRRFISEEEKKQQNIESIIDKTLPNLKDDSKPEKVESDWISNFFDKCRIVSDEEMQNLWAKVLAGEANSPGKYSTRTVNLLASIDKYDATLFKSLCGFVWQINFEPIPLIYEPNEPIYTKHNISFQSLSHLDEIGLITFNSVMSFVRIGFPKRVAVFYHATPVSVEFPSEKDNTLQIGTTFLSRTGREMATICGSKPVPGFTDYVFEIWKQQSIDGHLVS